jgi:hypothetical protein
MLRLKSLKDKNVFFTAFKVKDSTNRMFETMKSCYGVNFNYTDYTFRKEFFETMLDTITKSIEKSMESTKRDLENLVSNTKEEPMKQIKEYDGPK